ncbi:MAG: carboxypeptidase-like regulatory domain-containing protein [Saprospirales bacterium]|nr:carboxypeptidase-like regulatory domain-containing protein [Saprospirales bacterium]MBK8922313.1 carboxypeptidase-like regulatory domain-containing protein [Saprospirales bacterium]
MIRGQVTDAETRQPVPFAGIGVPETGAGARADAEGRYELHTQQQFHELRITALGYQPQTVPVKPGTAQTIDIALAPENTRLEEVIIKPGKYRNKNNPAVELIKLVVAHRDENRVENLQTFREEQYEKVIIGFSNLSERLKGKKTLRSIRFLLDNVDTTKLDGLSVVPVFLQENIQDLVLRAEPHSRKLLVRASQSVKFPGYLEQEGINKALRYLNQEVNLYDNYVVLLTDHFLSPVSNLAPMFYRYYPMDTLEVSGIKVVRLAFFPRNKTDMLLQGDLYIALDSTYPVVRATFGVNPEINLNWVKSLELQQNFQRLPSGKWFLAYEDYRMDFGLGQKGAGLFGQRLVSHREPLINTPLPDSLFQKQYADVVYLPGATRTDTAYWAGARHFSLNGAEAATYGNMDSLQNTRLFKNTARALLLASIGYVNAGPHFEIGPINTFYAFNPVEGNRFRMGGRTSSSLSKRFNVDAYTAYGLSDQRWKFGAAVTLALRGTACNQFPINLLRIKYQKDVRIPGQELAQGQTNNLFTSFVRGVNDKFVYYNRFGFEHEREFQNHFSYAVGLEQQTQQPAGALRFDPVDVGQAVNDPLTTTKAYVRLRYAPGEKFFQTATYRQTIDVNYIATLHYARGIDGFYGGEYNFQEIRASFYKFSNLPPIGYNYLYLEAGGVFGKVPYPLLTIHRANQTYVYQLYSYNLMNFMEFISDRYIALNMDHNFYGFFLNKIPLIRKLKLREMITLKILYGAITPTNRPYEGSGLYRFPAYPDGSPITYTLEAKPYVEASIGISNLFKVLRIDLVRRFSYLDHPGAPKYGVRGMLQLQF